jgi:hypothetical protein
MKIIVGVHVLIGYGAIVDDEPILPHGPSHCRSMVRILVKKTSFWSNNHSCPNQKRNGAQAADDSKVPFHLTSPCDLDLAHGFESELFIILDLARKPFSQ